MPNLFYCCGVIPESARYIKPSNFQGRDVLIKGVASDIIAPKFEEAENKLLTAPNNGNTSMTTNNLNVILLLSYLQSPPTSMNHQRTMNISKTNVVAPETIPSFLFLYAINISTSGLFYANGLMDNEPCTFSLNIINN